MGAPQKKLYFVRHGECQFNLRKVFAGRSDSPLTSLGKKQAQLAAEDILIKRLKIDRVVSSPLWRARETANIIARGVQYPADGIISSDLFIERNFGMLEGTPRADFFDAYSYEDIDNAPRAETLEQLHKRAAEAYAFIQSLPDDNILIVSHSGFYRAFRRAISGDSFAHEYTSPFLAIKNGTVYSLLD